MHADMRVLRECAGRCRGTGSRTTDAELRVELRVPGIPTLLRHERLRYVARAARAGLPHLSALLQNAGGKTTPWMAMNIEDLHALRAREGWKLSNLPEFSEDPRPCNKLWIRFPKVWQTMVNAAFARDFPAYSFGEVVAAASTVQRCEVCETIFESGCVALRTHMYRVHGNRGLARRFVADKQCTMCKKSFVTRARAAQNGNITRCKHDMLNGECVENAPEEQSRLDHEMAVFRCNARRAGLSFVACTKADGSA